MGPVQASPVHTPHTPFSDDEERFRFASSWLQERFRSPHFQPFLSAASELSMDAMKLPLKLNA